MAARVQYPGAQEFLPPTDELPTLAAAATGCRGCDLWEAATQVVFGRGGEQARLMLVGEQPGDVEDVQGKPFVGPAGRLLVQALKEAELFETPTYVTNAVKHFSYRQSGKRRIHQTPTAGQVTACRPWLQHEHRAVDPALTVLLGGTAAKSMLGPSVRVLRDRGTVLEQEFDGRPAQFLVTVHPSSVLRATDEDRDAAYGGLVADLRVATRFLA